MSNLDVPFAVGRNQVDDGGVKTEGTSIQQRLLPMCSPFCRCWAPCPPRTSWAAAVSRNSASASPNMANSRSAAMEGVLENRGFLLVGYWELGQLKHECDRYSSLELEGGGRDAFQILFARMPAPVTSYSAASICIGGGSSISPSGAPEVRGLLVARGLNGFFWMGVNGAK